jgi:hypothetical protein
MVDAQDRALRRIGTGIGVAFLAAAAVLYWVPDYAEAPRIGPPDGGLSGAEVAARHCQTCHMLPQPSQLPKETWPFVIDWMGNYLGYKKLFKPFGHITDRSRVPDEPVVSVEEMSRLGRYFLERAPEARDFVIHRPHPPPLEGYVATALPDAGDDGEVVTLLHVDEERGHLYVGTANDRKLRIFDRQRTLRVMIELDSEAIDVAPRDRGFRLTLAGDYARDERRGSIVEYDFADDQWNGLRRRALATGLRRTIESHAADLDRDGREDLVVVSFGDGFGPGTGSVSILWAREGFESLRAAAPERIDAANGPWLPGAYDEQVLLDRAGGLGAQIVDLDGNGWLDVLVLAAQGGNELVAWLGRGERRFERHVIERQHVSFGYNQLRATDVDGDGNVDLVVTNGNNMEMKTPPLRPYHGVRLLLGDGQLGFREAFSFPMYGALTSVVRDLDGDGDVDIAVNSLFPNWYAEEPETFTVLENRGDLRFEPRTLGGDHWGRWLRIAAGDLDGDGRVELFLGSGNTPGGGLHPERPRQWERWRRRLSRVPAVLVLEPNGPGAGPSD